ncbi:radical SAM protein [Ethanoligenens harbinense]|uniref:Radical SAM domain protein n=1 Tax=Ethanoligenens harbinense (strain DSM 18485 / JCM 12961 / CGMCC 1.5033 / YUAN-3) TaxID=663278 RepID=E6U572_ETHHY|nr:radical SAM protein [Ethanoligenens harbinense]ADU27885.1 Radical SAM domain protein [Ethanoligenens harbinense YUAN-3]AVQ96914.1 radical SAM protein [Ethanoligenens harbinense YUAN-3]AYF39575.1 radical SAM protein [Ethanoligenens harbinense]AYF42401.1 radical SAM protein [Ethanoligenens harbinense]QCN93154.1 radical SAM protein [Ethanoligenens harbinense]
MINAKQILSKLVLNEVYKYVDKDPMKNLNKMINWAEKVMTKTSYASMISMFREIAEDPNSNWYKLIERYFTELNKNTQKRFLTNFIVNAGLVGNTIIDKSKAKYDCNVPWAILMDPTTACNLKCTGCWAAEYANSVSLSYEQLASVIEQGKKLGIYMYLFSGGEPLVRKKDLLRLAEENNDCMFLAFTNATLIDEEFAAEVERLGNFAFAISVEGFEEETDMRRGKGTYQAVMNAMDILHRHGIIFGFSTCYHSKNTDVVGSDEWLDLMIEKGCTFGWYFTYMPIGKDAVTDLLARPEQREYMYRQLHKFRGTNPHNGTKPIFLLDFWNDGEYVGGCIAGGRVYLHINANGDVEPCAFIHYSNANIKEQSLLEALQSPLFQEYKKGQPFNENMLRPCPLLDNPEKLRGMVNTSGAHSTQYQDNESAEEVTAKTEEISKEWKETADRIWETNPNNPSQKETVSKSAD